MPGHRQRHDDACGTDAVEVFDLGDNSTRANAFASYARWQARGPVTRVVLTAGEEMNAASEALGGGLGHEIFLVTGYEETASVLVDARFTVDPRAGLTDEERAQLPPVPEAFRPLAENLLTLDGPAHSRLRRLVQPSFTPRKIEALRSRVDRIANELLDDADRAAEARGESAPDRCMELVESFAYPLPLTVISEMMGVPIEERPMVRAWAERLLNSGEEGWAEASITALGEFSDYLRDLFAAKSARPSDDLMSELVHAEDDGSGLSEDELLSMVFILLFAGHFTTVNLIGNGVVALLNYPDQLAQLRTDPGAVKNAVEEILRLWGPVEMSVPRHALEDLDLGGTFIPKGSTVTPVLAAADRDPARFGCPAEFDITRSDANRHLAFARGAHVCIGAPLARVEGQVALKVLFSRMTHVRLASPAAEAELLPSLFRGLARLELRY